MPRDRRRQAPVSSGIWCLVFDFGDQPGLGAAGGSDRGFVVQPLAEQCPGQRRVDADPVLAGVGFVVADDAQAHFLAVLVFKGHEGAEEHPLGVRRQAVDDLQLVEAIGQVANAGDDPMQLFLIVGVKEPLPSNTISKVFFIDD